MSVQRISEKFSSQLCSVVANLRSELFFNDTCHKFETPRYCSLFASSIHCILRLNVNTSQCHVNNLLLIMAKFLSTIIIPLNVETYNTSSTTPKILTTDDHFNVNNLLSSLEWRNYLHLNNSLETYNLTEYEWNVDFEDTSSIDLFGRTANEKYLDFGSIRHSDEHGRLNLEEFQRALARQSDTSTQLDKALILALRNISEWGPKAVARSTMTAIGSVMVSILVGLVLWLGILQILGVPRRRHQHNVQQRNEEFLNAMATKLIKDFKRHRHYSEGRDNRQKEEVESLPSAISVDIASPSFVKPVNTIKKLEHDTFAHTSSKGKKQFTKSQEISVTFPRNRKVYYPLKQFFPSPVDEIIDEYTTQMPLQSRDRESGGSRVSSGPKLSISHLIRHPVDRIVRQPHIPMELKKPLYLKRKIVRVMPVSNQNRSKLVLEHKNTNGENEIIIDENDRSNKYVSSDHMSVKKDLSSQFYLRNESPTKSPVRITTFRSVRRNSFLNTVKSDPNAVETYFPNNYQPINLYKYGFNKKLIQKEMEPKPYLRRYPIHHLKNLYNTYFDESNSQSHGLEYVINKTVYENDISNFSDNIMQEDLNEASDLEWDDTFQGIEDINWEDDDNYVNDDFDVEIVLNDPSQDMSNVISDLTSYGYQSTNKNTTSIPRVSKD